MRPSTHGARNRLAGRNPLRPGAMRFRGARRAVAMAVVGANAAVIVWLWLHDGGVSGVHSTGGLFTSLGRITGLLGAYLLFIQVLLLARLRRIERLVGFDRLTVWHRVNGKVCFYLILAHVLLITIGYALLDRVSVPHEVTTLLNQYPGIIDAAIGTGLLILVVVTSLVIVRRRLRYEAWYLVHLTAYAAVILAWFHQLPTGNDFILNPAAARYWTVLYLVTLALVLLFRLVLPIFYGFWYQLRVAEVNVEGPNVVSLRITGRHLGRLGAWAGQFFLWRFLTWKLAWESHPFSLSAAPDGQSLRITVKSLGDFTSRIGEVRPGTRVLGEGPFGLFTDAVRHRNKVLLIAGGVGITPIRGLLEEMSGDIVLVYRVVREEEAVFRDELEELARERGIKVSYVTGDRREPGGERLLSSEHLRELVPDIAQREVYVCGPPAMSDSVEMNVRQAGVPQKYIHSERFAFSPDAPSGKRVGLTPTRTRLSIFVLFLAAVAAVAARFVWIATHSTSAVSAAAAIPTVKPTSVSATHPAVPTAKPTRAAKPTAVPVAHPAAVQYTGAAVSSQYGPIQVAITVGSSRITAVTVSASPDSPRSQIIEAQAIPILKSETLQAQSASVNTVSGATDISNAYIQSLQSALSKAHL